MQQDRWDRLVDYLRDHLQGNRGYYGSESIKLERIRHGHWRVGSVGSTYSMSIALECFGLRVEEDIQRISLRQDPRKLRPDVMMFNSVQNQWFRWSEGWTTQSCGTAQVDQYTVNKKREYLEREVGREYLNDYMSMNPTTQKEPKKDRAKELKDSRPARLARLWKDKYMRTGIKPSCLQLT